MSVTHIPQITISQCILIFSFDLNKIYPKHMPSKYGAICAHGWSDNPLKLAKRSSALKLLKFKILALKKKKTNVAEYNIERSFKIDKLYKYSVW